MTATPTVPANRSRFGHFTRGFAEGLRLPGRGLAYLAHHRDLWPYALIPMLINLAITLLLLAAFLVAAYSLLSWMHTLPYFAATGWGRLQEFLAAIVALAALLALALGIYVFLAGLIAATFNEKLAIQVEIQLGTPASLLQPTAPDFWDAIRDSLLIVGTLILSLLIGCIPLLGAIAGPAINFYVDCRILGHNFFVIPLNLRRTPPPDRRTLALQHRPQLLGLGAAVLLINLIPLLGSLFLTTATVGSVLFHHDLRQRDPTAPP